MSSPKKMTLTGVKVKSDLFENFKIECVKRKFSFQKLADRALFLYLTDENFRKQITNQITKQITNEDTKISLALSSGVDSTLILSIIKKKFPQINIETISIKFADSFDESESAHKIAEHFGVNHSVIYIENYLKLDLYFYR